MLAIHLQTNPFPKGLDKQPSLSGSAALANDAERRVESLLYTVAWQALPESAAAPAPGTWLLMGEMGFVVIGDRYAKLVGAEAWSHRPRGGAFPEALLWRECSAGLRTGTFWPLGVATATL